MNFRGMNMMADRAIGWVKAKQQQTELKKKETIEKEEYNKLVSISKTMLRIGEWFKTGF